MVKERIYPHQPPKKTKQQNNKKKTFFLYQFFYMRQSRKSVSPICRIPLHSSEKCGIDLCNIHVPFNSDEDLFNFDSPTIMIQILTLESYTSESIVITTGISFKLKPKVTWTNLFLILNILTGVSLMLKPILVLKGKSYIFKPIQILTGVSYILKP